MTPQKRQHIIVTAVALIATTAFIALLYAGLGFDQQKLPNTIEGKPAYDFKAEWIQGQDWLPAAGSSSISLGDLRGKPLVLNFWASWCVSCRQEAHELEAFWKKYRDDGVMVVGIAIQDTQEDAQKFARYFGKTYILALDNSGKASIDYGVTGVPETFIINREGIVVHKEVGPVDTKLLEKYLPQIL